MKASPTIGITMQTLPGVPGQKPDSWIMSQRYVRALLGYGATPWMIPAFGEEDSEVLDRILDRIDGLLIPGGIDVDPAQYSAERKSYCGAGDNARDYTELYLVREAARRGIPVLGICRGMQVINVALGGTLYQDIAQERPGSLKHDHFDEGEVIRDRLIHEVQISEGSRLRSILGNEVVMVNSLHHQGIRDLGEGIKASAYAPDNLVEAVEGEDTAFLVGVQWHPEELLSTSAAMRNLFIRFIGAC